MNIEKLDTRHYRIPLTTPMTDSTHGSMTHFEVIMVEVTTTGGAQGLGYCYTIGQGGGAVRSLIEADLKPVLLGADAGRIEQLWERMWWRLHFVGRGGLVMFAIAAIDIALWDLRGNVQGEPLWRLLGGRSGSAQPYAGGIDLHLSKEGLVEQTRENLANGFRAIKMKVGLDSLHEDVDRVEAVRDLLGPDIPLMVDANMRWSVEQATRAARLLIPYDLTWLEEPTIPDDVKGHARIAREGGLPLATGENLHTIFEFRTMIEEGGISFPEPDVATIGGITNWMRVARLAHASNLPVTSHGLHELHLHLLSAVPNPSFLEVHGFGLERFMTDTPALEDGVMVPPDRPGHGVDFDWDALAPYRVDA